MDKGTHPDLMTQSVDTSPCIEHEAKEDENDQAWEDCEEENPVQDLIEAFAQVKEALHQLATKVPRNGRYLRIHPKITHGQ